MGSYSYIFRVNDKFKFKCDFDDVFPGVQWAKKLQLVIEEDKELPKKKKRKSYPEIQMVLLKRNEYDVNRENRNESNFIQKLYCRDHCQSSKSLSTDR
jgi:hypothetical protein